MIMPKPLTLDSMPFAPFGASVSRKIVVLTGQRFGNLLVVSSFAKHAHKTFWLCKCDCGTWVVRQTTRLRKGVSLQSCGCLTKSAQLASVIKHGQSSTSEYHSYISARQRCQNPKSQQFRHYGERGIEFRFNSFEEFYAELGSRPSPKHSLDRINNDGHYEKGNVRWATTVEQSENRRISRTLTWQGETLSIDKWAERLQVSRATLDSRMRQGWSTEQILTISTEGRHRKRAVTTQEDTLQEITNANT